MQITEHPGCVPAAKFLKNGDIVTACCDDILRFWTLDHGKTKTADTEELDSSSASQISLYKLSEYSSPISIVTYEHLI